MSGMIYGDSFVCGNLLRSELLNKEEIILLPGEKYEKELKIRRGLSSKARKVKVIFTEAGEEFTRRELDLGENIITGTAIDSTIPGDLFDIYFLIVNEAPHKLEKSHSYLLEVTLNKMPKNKFLRFFRWLYDPEVMYSELYGPYNVKSGSTNLFSQQMKYDPKFYNGDYIMNTKVYSEGRIVAEDEFKVNLR